MYNMNEHYDALMKLCEGDSSFYYVDQKLDDSMYRVFSYRIASYTEFLQPYALDSRGHMFVVNAEGKPIRMAAMTMQKFFNHLENPMTMDLDFSVVDSIMDKVDGSLISSFIHAPAQLRLKSKTSVSSDQAQAAMKYLATNKELYHFVEVMTANEYTVNMEYTAPDNRIVVPHQEVRLTVLNVRSTRTAEYMKHSAIKATMTHMGCEEFLVRNIVDEVEDYTAFIESIDDMLGVEGFIVVLPDGKTVKIKTNWYSALHRAKDSVNSPKALFEVVVSEAHDDLRASFHDDPYVLSRLAEMEVIVQKIYVDIKHNVEQFYNANKHLDRKSYAILGQNTVPKLYFGLTMSIYLGKELNYKEWMLSHYRDFGIKDELEPSSDV